jgi:NADPH-dependent 2,4-dienoyl-CoA reductase/sulfur reductase-like enzyme
MHLLVLGGSDAGISAALRARELRSDIEVSVIVADAFPNFSVCGLPYFLSGEVPDWRKLAHRSLEELESMGIRFELNTRATGIEVDRHTVVVQGRDGKSQNRSYDRLIVATGALPIRPNALNLDQPGVYVLRTMEDSLRLHERLARRDVREAAIVGSAYIGLEMAEALTYRGIHVTLLGRSATALPSVDTHFGDLVGQELRNHGVDVRSGVEVVAIEQDAKGLAVRAANDEFVNSDLVLVAAGVRPNSELAARAGAATGLKGAIRVDRRMATNLPDVFAAGDCIETWHRVLDTVTYLPLGTTAHKQGRVAGENAVGGQREFQGSLGTQVVRVFDLAAARTDLRDDDAREAGCDPFTVETSAWDHTPYYPGAHQVCIRITGDPTTGRLLGAQLLGPSAAEIDKRIDVYATALFKGLSVDAINDLDLSYTPPFGTPWDAVQSGAQVWERSVRVASPA